MANTEDRDHRGNKKEDELSDLARGYRVAERYTGAVFALVASVGILSWVGYQLDKKLEHQVPWLLLVGAAVGMIGGFISFFKTVLGAGRDERKGKK